MQPSGAMKRMELYAGARHLATYDIASNATYFIHGDWQGSERMRTNTAGASYETCYNLPFGDGQTCAGGADISPMHFTGKPRDTETTLDYFGARYYNSSGARWMSPDWAAKPATVPYAQFGDPQSLNLYGYVTDNPVSRQDGDGHLINIYQLYSSGGGSLYNEYEGTSGNEGSQLEHDANVAAGQEAQKAATPPTTPPPPAAATPTTSEQQATSEKQSPMYMAGRRGGRRKGERGRTAKPSGTDNPDKKFKPDPNRPGWLIGKDQNGKPISKPDPAAAPPVPEPERVGKPGKKSMIDQVNDWLNENLPDDIKNYLRSHPYGPNSSPGSNPGSVSPVFPVLPFAPA